MTNKNWELCLQHLEHELNPQDIDTYIRPLRVRPEADGSLKLLAPNSFIRDQITNEYLERIRDILEHLGLNRESVTIHIGQARPGTPRVESHETRFVTGLDPNQNFSNFVQGKSNELGAAAAQQVAKKPGRTYNPLLLYGGTGLGKTHLLHACGNLILKSSPRAKVLYLHSEQFINDMISALRQGTINDFKNYYRNLDVLLIDDIQFFAGKDATQEEFFHTFNTLVEGQQQIILTCDRYPKEVKGIESRLRSRFGWGLTVAIEPPDFETRVAILMSKADEKAMDLPEDVAFLLAKRMRSNVRDLEGALNSLSANSRFTGRPIDVAFATETLRDLLMVHDRLISIENIQRTVAEYYKIRVSDILGKRRQRSIVRPRQIAMSLAKELTDHSLPEIGDAFGGKDHTTVMHACRVMEEKCETDARLREDWSRLLRELTT